MPFYISFSSVQFSLSVMSDSWRPHELQHARPPCPSPTPGVHPNPCPSSRWCHPTISSSVVPFSSCPQSFPESGSFPMSQLFAWGGQSIGVSASSSVFPMNTQDWSLGWTGWISLQSKGLSRVFSNATVQKHQFFSAQLSFFFLQVKPFISPLVRTFEGSSDEACKVKVKSLSRVRLFATPWAAAYQAPPSKGFSRQEYWSGLPFPSPSAFFIVQLSHPYMTTGKTIALTR